MGQREMTQDDDMPQMEALRSDLSELQKLRMAQAQVGPHWSTGQLGPPGPITLQPWRVPGKKQTVHFGHIFPCHFG